jgi:uncharacterized protein (DUF58 family)
MTGQLLVAIGLILAGTLLDAPIAVMLGVVSLLLELVRQVWARRGITGVQYRRRLARDRASWGDEIPLTIEVWNRKRLPLAWLRADDAVSPAVVVRERSLTMGDAGRQNFRNVWTLAPFERVARHYHVGAERRGVFELGPVELTVGDLFAREAAIDALPGVDRFLVRPRTVAAPELRRLDRWDGLDRARAGLSEDPSRFAGVREYAPGDPLRRIHPRTSARLGRPMTKRFEPSRDREVLIAIDVQTGSGPVWQTTFDDDEVEALYVVAASLARSLAGEGAAFGLAAGGYSGAETRFAHVPISSAPGQVARVLDVLARLSSNPSAPFEQLLTMVARVTRPGTTVVVVSARDPGSYAGHLRNLKLRGWEVAVLACGPHGPANAAVARAAGLAARSARLDGPWRTAEHLAVAQ